jgi:hypothetical protein
MKVKVFFVLIPVFFLITKRCFSQNQSEVFPAAGTNFIMAKAPVYGARKLKIRDLGRNTWDLSGFLPQSFDTIRLKEPIQTRYGRRFPESTIALVISPVHIEYLVVDSGKVFLTGFIGDFMEKNLPILLQFKNRLMYKNPELQLDQNYSDTSGTTFLSPYFSHPATDSIRADITYIRTGRIDASGQLITPVGRYQVEREVVFIEKIVKGYKHTIFGWTPAPEYSLNKHYTFYRWYSKEFKIPVAEAFLDDDDYVDYVTYQYDSPLRMAFTGTHVRCKDGSDGSIQLTVNGGIPDYTYNWSNGESGSNLSNLRAGTYSVLVTDNRGRKISSYYTVTEPQHELIASLNTKHISCRGQKDGEIRLQISGGTAPYDFKWSVDSAKTSITNLSPGMYKAWVVDASGCAHSDSVSIIQPEAALSVKFEEKQVSCFRGNDGAVHILPQGGTPPYRAIWADGDTSIHRRDLKAGVYKLTVFDRNNCQANGLVVVKEPEKPIKLEKSVSEVACFGQSSGNVDLVISGGKAPYQIRWDNGLEGKTLKGIPSGQYTFSVTDKNGCIVRDCVFVSQPVMPLKIDFLKTDVACYGESTGEIKLQASGGTKDYTFSWSNGSDKPVLSKLSIGSYTVKVSDKNKCLASQTIEIEGPEKPLAAETEIQHVRCNGGLDGSVVLNLSGGTPDYQVVWSNKTYAKDATGLKAGNYSVQITDKNNCRLKKDFRIEEPEKKIEVQVQKSDVDCFGAKNGFVRLDVKGGKPGYGFEWSNGSTSGEISELEAGTYQVTITDAARCVVVKKVELSGPGKLAVQARLIHPDKDRQNGSIKIDIKGGTGPYHIFWGNGQTTSIIENLKEGVYEVKITDSKDCQHIETFELTGK